MPEPSPRALLSGFISKFSPPIAAQARAVLAALRTRLPGAVELVYDNYNALAIGFGPSERMSDLIVSIAVYPRWVSLFFFNPGELDDPERLLKGSGTMVRHLVLASVDDLGPPRRPGAAAPGGGGRRRAPRRTAAAPAGDQVGLGPAAAAAAARRTRASPEGGQAPSPPVAARRRG